MSVTLSVLASGSSGNCALLRMGDFALMIDAGVSARRITCALQELGVALQALCGVLITHEHGDHVAGALALGRAGVPLYMNSQTFEVLRQKWGERMPRAKIFQNGEVFNLGVARVLPVPVAHDAYDPVAFRIELGGRVIGFATDIGHPSRLVVERFRGCDILVLESNHDVGLLQADGKRPWSVKQRILSRHGHLSNEVAARLARELVTERTRHLVLGHLSGDCNSLDVVREAFAALLSQADQRGLGVTVIEPGVVCWRHVVCDTQQGECIPCR